MVPTNLRRWFVLHFIVDMTFAFPLLIIPEQFLTFLKWGSIDPLASRLVGAALMGIGFGAFVSRKASSNAYVAMLNMKIIWSLSAIFGLLITMLSGGPIFGRLIILLFAVFSIAWIYYGFHLHNYHD
jgi:hypothetical protein